MAGLFHDGMGHYATAQLTTKWTNSNQGAGSTATIASPGRYGTGNCLQQSASVTGVLVGINKAFLAGAQSSLVHGFAWMYGANHFLTPGTVIWAFYDSLGNVLATICVNAAGGLEYRIGLMSTLVVASAPGIVNVQAWGHVGVDVVFASGATGSVSLYWNGSLTPVATISSVITAANNSGCAMSGPAVYFTASGDSPNVQSYQDIYMFNHATGVNNAFIGDYEALSQMPAADGHETAWSEFPGTGNNWQKINEIPPDGDATYIFDATVNDKNASTITALSGITAVAAVQLCVYARKDNSPARSLGIGFSDGTTDVIDAGHFLNTSYAYALSYLDQDPVTSGAWTPTLVNAGQVVVSVLS